MREFMLLHFAERGAECSQPICSKEQPSTCGKHLNCFIFRCFTGKGICDMAPLLYGFISTGWIFY